MPVDPLGDALRRWASTNAPAESDVRRLLATSPRRRRPMTARWAVAAAGLLSVAAWWWTTSERAPGEGVTRDAHPQAIVGPPPTAPEPPLTGSRPLATGRASPIPGVLLKVDGAGGVRTAPDTLAVDWTVGTLEVEVEPGKGLAVDIVTEEARIQVVGTGFQVRRSALGTEVAVRHGVVAVTCQGGGPQEVVAGGSRLCLPTTASGFLSRARALELAGAPPGEVRAAAETGLAGDVPPSVRGELEVVRMRTFLAEGDRVQALAAAGAYLGAGYPERRPEVLALAAGLTEGLGRCDEARRWRAESGQEEGPCGR